MSLNRNMDKENVLHLHQGVLLSLTTDIMKLSSKWMELGKVILNDAAQTQKYKS